jgi:hypothetical protein
MRQDDSGEASFHSEMIFTWRVVRRLRTERKLADKVISGSLAFWRLLMDNELTFGVGYSGLFRPHRKALSTSER